MALGQLWPTGPAPPARNASKRRIAAPSLRSPQASRMGAAQSTTLPSRLRGMGASCRPSSPTEPHLQGGGRVSVRACGRVGEWVSGHKSAWVRGTSKHGHRSAMQVSHRAPFRCKAGVAVIKCIKSQPSPASSWAACRYHASSAHKRWLREERRCTPRVSCCRACMCARQHSTQPCELTWLPGCPWGLAVRAGAAAGCPGTPASHRPCKEGGEAGRDEAGMEVHQPKKSSTSNR